MNKDDFLPNKKENDLARDGTVAVLEFVYAVLFTSWIAGFVGVFFLYQTYKTMKAPGEIHLKRMIIPAIIVTIFFVSMISFLRFVLRPL